MTLKTIAKTSLRKTASKNGVVICTIPKGKSVTIEGTSIKWVSTAPFVKVSYDSNTGWILARYLKGMFLKSSSTGDSKYPRKAVIANPKTGKKKPIKIPQQTKFGTFCSEHGCSVAAVSVALQLLGISKTPYEVYTWAKNNIGDYTGSKLAIYGAMKAINRISGTSKATWKPVTSGNTSTVKENIADAIADGCFVLLEQKSPIHTNIIIGRCVDGKYAIATNGVVKKVTLNSLVNGALCGVSGADNQDKWFKTSKNAAGYVIVKP